MTTISASYTLEVENRAELDNAVQEFSRIHPNLTATRINYQQKSQWNQALNNYEYLPIFVATISFSTLRMGTSGTNGVISISPVEDDYLD